MLKTLETIINTGLYRIQGSGLRLNFYSNNKTPKNVFTYQKKKIGISGIY